MKTFLLLGFLLTVASKSSAFAEENNPQYLIWQTVEFKQRVAERNRVLPARDNEEPPAIRMTDIEEPYLTRFDPPASKANGTSVVILPGGAYRYAVVGKEGAEIAKWFNGLGVTAFVLHYRTPTNQLERNWFAPVQDAQQAIRFLRARANELKIAPNKIGMIGFSAGGNAAAIASTNMDIPSLNAPSKGQTQTSARPDFTMLIYPWRLLNKDESGLRKEVVVDAETPPTFLVHTHDDGATSLSSIEFYKAMKRLNRPAELHLYQSGGHGYGLRKVKGSNVHTWVDRVVEWMKTRRLLLKSQQ